MEKKIQKKFFLLEIIPSELAALNCLYQKDNTSDRHSMCQKVVLRYCLSLRETFSNLIVLKVVNKYGKSGATQI